MRRQGNWVYFCLLLPLASLGCRTGSPDQPSASSHPEPGARSQAPGASPFTEVAVAGSVTFRHATGGAGPLNLLQTTGAGCAMFDYDGDGWLDLFLVGSAPPANSAARNALYRNNRDGTFADVTAATGVQGNYYGQGCVAADYDGDGDLDLLVTGYGGNTLYQNDGKGRFADITAASGLTLPDDAAPWSSSAAFADFDADGDLDLYIGRYLLFTPSTPQLCPHNDVPLACSPTLYDPQRGILYRNDGKGKFTDVTRQAGAVSSGRTLGVVWCDFDDDGRPDLFVANDNSPNNLFHNDGGGRFHDVAVAGGLAYGPQGSPEASMGVDAGDYDGDGRFDLFFTNFQQEGVGLYRNGGEPGFFAAADRAGILAPTLPVLGFGAGFLDFDNDGHLDLFTANGHVQEAIQQVDAASSFAQVRQLFHNRGNGTFDDLTATAGPALTEPAVGRGVAFGDIDNDGDLDILVNNNGGRAMLLRNELRDGEGAPHWLRVRLVGRAPNRFAVGARVTLVAGGRRQVREVRAGHSYASSSDVRLHLGLGERSRAERITVRWPAGRVTTLARIAADREIALQE